MSEVKKDEEYEEIPILVGILLMIIIPIVWVVSKIDFVYSCIKNHRKYFPKENLIVEVMKDE